MSNQNAALNFELKLIDVISWCNYQVLSSGCYIVQHGGKRFACGFTNCVDKYKKPNDYEKGLQELVWHCNIDIEEHKWAVDTYKAREK